MKQSRLFLEDGSQFGVSRSAFRRMRKAQERALMLEWWNQINESQIQTRLR
jgi:hypothetical protein